METSKINSRKRTRLKAQTELRWLRLLCNPSVLRWLIKIGAWLFAIARAVHALISMFKS